MNQEVARVFVGTDQRMGPAERALERSIRAHSGIPAELNWMRAGQGQFGGWHMRRRAERPYSGSGWPTEFTPFRFAVPELAGFKGRAIYLDADMVLGDIRELWERLFDAPGLVPETTPRSRSSTAARSGASDEAVPWRRIGRNRATGAAGEPQGKESNKGWCARWFCELTRPQLSRDPPEYLQSVNAA